MTDTSAQVRSDFDRIALADDSRWDNNVAYHDVLLSHLPAHCKQALDIGCGSGAFTRRLATRCDSVLGIDLSPEMIRLARLRSQGLPGVSFVEADALAFMLPPDHFDCIASIATLHHIPMEPIVEVMKRALAPGGLLLVLDLVRSVWPRDLLREPLALAMSAALRLAHTGRLLDSAEARRAWKQHARHDRYLTIGQVREGYLHLLPGARVRRHLLWRYSVVWRKP